MVKNLPAMQETKELQVSSLGQEDPLEEEIATHSGILAWKIPWTEESGWLADPRLLEEFLAQYIFLQRAKEHDKTGLQCSILDLSHVAYIINLSWGVEGKIYIAGEEEF